MRTQQVAIIHAAINRALDRRRAAPRQLYLAKAAIGMFVAVIALTGLADTPVTPNASPEAQSLLAFLHDIYGRKILSGQQEGARGTNELAFELNYIRDRTGKLPAVLGLDAIGCTRRERTGEPPADLAKHAINWYTRSNGIVTICWHWFAPAGNKAFYTKDTPFDLRRALADNTPEHTALLRDLDTVAEELAPMRDAGVPVLWRPLHEANGRWFWWGAQGPEPLTQLWRLMFDRFARQHQLTNLLWVYSPGASIDLADWYPGDEYVDIIGQDHYPMDGNDGPAKDVFDELAAFSGGTKLLALSENGPIPDPDRLVSEKAGWSCFLTWGGNILTQKNPKERLVKAYHHPYVLNLGDLPALRRYPYATAGRPVKLEFVAPPGPVAINGVRRRPVAVAVRDQHGRTVRNGSYRVSVTLSQNPGQGRLSGQTSVSTGNGLAVFHDLAIDKPGAGYSLTATAGGLQSATSDPFEVGPGTGLLIEWWTGLDTNRLGVLPSNPTRPDGREILARALEMPYGRKTNYTARLRGWLLPPLTGLYTFWVASEGTAELWLSTDGSPTNQVRIAAVAADTPYAKWPHTSEAGSSAVRLEAGKRYYLEVRRRQDAGSAHLSVRWRLPDGTEERPVPMCRLAALTADSPEFKLAQQDDEGAGAGRQ